MPSRREFLKQNSLLAAGARAAWVAPFVVTSARSAPSAPIAETANGKLRGRTEDGIHVFRGVPYGADTSGKNRFMPPRKPAPWQGTRDALEWGHVAPQPLPSGNYDYTRAVQWATQPGGRGEDCLVLNVWTPGLKDGGRRAVLVSIHGGGYTSGTSHNPVFDGRALARRGNVVVVTVNHRLGALGYLHLGELAPEFAESGVVGLMDLVAALQWVRDNIANFGGDPGKVLIFGQSGGGSKVCHLMAMPSAKGLFHRAAAQSGAALRSGTRENAARSAERLIAQLGIPKSRLRDLQDAPYEMIIGAQGASGAVGLYSGPAWGQATNSGDVTGSVTDPSGAVVPGVKVLVKDIDKNTERIFITNDAGLYDTGPLVPSDQYLITFSKEGFATLQRGPLTLRSGVTGLNVQLTIGQATQQISIMETGAPLLETTTAEISSTVAQETLKLLPQTGGIPDWQSFLTFLPGTRGNGGNNGNAGMGGTSVNGSMPFSNALLDGASTSSPMSNNVINTRSLIRSAK